MFLVVSDSFHLKVPYVLVKFHSSLVFSFLLTCSLCCKCWGKVSLSFIERLKANRFKLVISSLLHLFIKPQLNCCTHWGQKTQLLVYLSSYVKTWHHSSLAACGVVCNTWVCCFTVALSFRSGAPCFSWSCALYKFTMTVVFYMQRNSNACQSREVDPAAIDASGEEEESGLGLRKDGESDAVRPPSGHL